MKNLKKNEKSSGLFVFYHFHAHVSKLNWLQTLIKDRIRFILPL